MNFFIVDDDHAVRAILSQIIEEEKLGSIIGEAADGTEINTSLLANNQIDILLLDFLMPSQDGVETIRRLENQFEGKIVMISQIKTKDLIGEAYALGIEYYITKPINRLEIVSVLHKVKEQILLEKSIQGIQSSLSHLNLKSFSSSKDNKSRSSEVYTNQLYANGKKILLELGVPCEGGYNDFLDILKIIDENEMSEERKSIPLQKIFKEMISNRSAHSKPRQKDIKAAEQRVRRAIHQSLEHIACLGLTDYSNPTFEHYALTYFDFSQVRLKMREIEGKADHKSPPVRVNIKHFIQALYMEASRVEQST